jgi:hypothetical protein
MKATPASPIFGLRALLAIAIVLAYSGTAACSGSQVAEQLDESPVTSVEELPSGAGTALPQTWPSDVPFFPNGSLVLVSSQRNGTATALWETKASVDSAAETYHATLISRGFSLDQDANFGGTIVRTYQGDRHNVNVTVASDAGVTNVSAAVVPR